jgi:hypothetical protein
MATVTTTHRTEPPRRTSTPLRWPLWGLAAGALGLIATVFTNQAVHHDRVGREALGHLSGTTLHVGGALGYVAVACLLVFAGCWRVRVCRAVPDSAAARVVADGLVASAAALVLGYGWKLALAIYLPGGIDSKEFGNEAKFIYFVLNDFGAFIGWLGVIVSAGAIAWLALRDKMLPTWLGVLSVLPVLAVAFMDAGLSVAGYQGIVGPIWLILAGAALTFGAHRIPT